jgi:tetratricopeptide (TPR) repeat protein
LIDNAAETDFRTIQKWQSTFRQFHFLITSRSQNTNLNTYTLGVLPKADALALFYTHYTFEQDDTVATRILEQLHDHTLLIELVAKAGQEGAIPLHDLLVFLQTGYIRHEGLQHKIDINEVLPDRIPEEERIINYIGMLFRTILKLDDDEQQVLLSLAALPNTPHDRELLLKILEGTGKKKAQTPLTPNEIVDILNALFKKGYLQRDDEHKKRFYALHALIGAATREHIPPTVGRLERVIGNVASLLRIDETKDNPVDKFFFIPYGENVLALFFDSTDVDISNLQNDLGRTLQAIGDYARAKDLLAMAIQSDEKNFGENHPYTAVRYSNLALIFRDLGDYVNAKSLLEKAVSANEANFGENHFQTVVSYSNLALVLRDLGDYSAAKNLFEKSIQWSEVNLGKEHPTTIAYYSNLALAFQSLGQYTVAKSLLEQVISAAETIFDQNHPNLATYYSNLAQVLQDLDDYHAAKTLLEKAVRSDEVNFGPHHPITANRYSNLGLALFYLNDYQAAQSLFEKAVFSAEVNLGKDHPTTAIYYLNLAGVFKAIGDYSAAKALLEKVIRSDETNFGENHPNTAIDYWNLAALYSAMAEHVTSLYYIQKSCSILILNLGDDHPYTINALNWSKSITSKMLENGWTEEQIKNLVNTTM